MQLAENHRRGLVNVALYDIDLTQAVGQHIIEERAENLVHQRNFSGRPQEYYQALTEALENDDHIGLEPDADQGVARDCTARLIEALDRRRPWHEPPFQRLRQHEHPDVTSLVRIAIVPLDYIEIGDRLQRTFTSAGASRVLFVKLRTGETIAFTTPKGPRQPQTSVMAETADPVTTIKHVRDLTGLEVQSV